MMVEASLLDFLFGGALDEAEAPKKTGKPEKARTLKPIRPNAGIESEYRRRITAMLDEMEKSVLFWLKAAYRRAPPEIAQDELSSSALRAAMRKLANRWVARFDDMADNLAKYFTLSVSNRTDAAMKKILKDGGFTIEWTMTRAQRDVVNATVAENVSLIKSIPRDLLGKVEGSVMRSVQTGRDLGQLTNDLQHQFGVTRRRAAFIAKDQNNKASSLLARARQIEIGVEEAVWCHSSGGHVPRPSHVKAGKEKVRYNVTEGWPDPALGGKRIWPGTEINCRCFARPVIKGLARR